MRDWVHKQAPAYGLAFPLLARGEDWHIEVAGAPGGAKVMPAGLGGATPPERDRLAERRSRCIGGARYADAADQQ